MGFVIYIYTHKYFSRVFDTNLEFGVMNLWILTTIGLAICEKLGLLDVVRCPIQSDEMKG